MPPSAFPVCSDVDRFQQPLGTAVKNVTIPSAARDQIVTCWASGRVTATQTGISGTPCGNGRHSYAADIATSATGVLTAAVGNQITLTGNGAFVDSYQASFTAVQRAGQTQTYYLRYHESSTARVRAGSLACFQSGTLDIAHESNLYCVAFPHQ